MSTPIVREVKSREDHSLQYENFVLATQHEMYLLLKKKDFSQRAEVSLRIGAFQQAYERIVAELVAAADSKELMRLSRVLSARVRSRCIYLACNKATDGSAEALQLEGFLEKVIEINGEDIYGRLPAHGER